MDNKSKGINSGCRYPNCVSYFDEIVTVFSKDYGLDYYKVLSVATKLCNRGIKEYVLMDALILIYQNYGGKLEFDILDKYESEMDMIVNMLKS